MKVSFRTVHNYYLCAERGGLDRINATRTVPAAWEEFEVEHHGDKIALKAVNGLYVCAEGGGGSDDPSWRGYLIANRPAAFAWELFKVVPGEGGGIALQADNGRHVSAENGGGGAVTVDKPWTFAHETFFPSSPLEAGAGGGGTRSGRVRLEGRTLVDDGGPFLAMGASLFWLAWGYKHDRARLAENLRWLGNRGFEYVRALGVVGPSGGWEDRTVDPNESDYEETIAGATDFAFDHGLRVEWTVFGGIDRVPSTARRREVIETFVRMAEGREHKIIFWEVANEGWQTGFDGDAGLAELRDLGRQLQRTGLLVALTGPRDSEVCKTYRDWDGLATIHYDRADGDDGWRYVRQPWGYPGEYREKERYEGPLPRAAVNSEPKGPQSSVSADDDPFRLTFAYLQTFVSQNAAYCLHTGAGVRGGGAADLARGRAANFAEVPRIDAIVQGMRAAKRYLPPDLPNWERQNAHWQGHPFAELNDAVGAGDIVRSNAAVRGGDFWITVFGARRSTSGKARRACRVDRIDPMTGDVIGSRDLNVDERYTFDGASGFILRGQFR